MSSVRIINVGKVEQELFDDYGVKARSLLVSLNDFLSEVNSISRWYDRFEVPNLELKFSYCQGDILVFLNQINCSDRYRRLLRRRLGLNGMELMLGLYKYSVSEETIVLYFRLID
jgi:hypothetical protein